MVNEEAFTQILKLEARREPTGLTATDSSQSSHESIPIHPFNAPCGPELDVKVQLQTFMMSPASKAFTHWYPHEVKKSFWRCSKGILEVVTSWKQIKNVDDSSGTQGHLSHFCFFISWCCHGCIRKRRRSLTICSITHFCNFCSVIWVKLGHVLWREYLLVLPLRPSGCSALNNFGWIALLVANVTAHKYTDNQQLLNEHLRYGAVNGLREQWQRTVALPRCFFGAPGTENW